VFSPAISHLGKISCELPIGNSRIPYHCPGHIDKNSEEPTVFISVGLFHYSEYQTL
jgi:hypothetical protein